MKNFFSNFLHRFLDSHILPVTAVMCSFFAVLLTADSFVQPEETAPDHIITMSAFFLGEAACESPVCTTSSSASPVETTGSCTTVPVTDDDDEIRGEIPVYEYDYIPAGESPNSRFYQDRLTIIGDSVAYGFNAYGYIPDQHNIAQESLSLCNMEGYYFDLGGGAMGITDAAAYVGSPLYYLSIGMNDLYNFAPDDYARHMRSVAEDILARVPAATIIVGAITPVSDGNYYTTNEMIDEFNAALEAVTDDPGSGRVIFFDTNAALKDPGTGALSYDYSGGDGLHLNSPAYSHVLGCLFDFLDTAGAADLIAEHENR